MPTELQYSFRGVSRSLRSTIGEQSDAALAQAFKNIQAGKEPGEGWEDVPRGPNTRKYAPPQVQRTRPMTATETTTQFLKGFVPQTTGEAVQMGAELTGATGGAAAVQRFLPMPARAALMGASRVRRGVHALTRATVAGLGAGGGALATGADLEEARSTAVMFGVGELGGLFLNKIMTNPFSGQVTPEGRQAIEVLRRFRARPTPGQATKSWALDLAENVGGAAVGGRTLLTNFKDHASVAASKAMIEFRRSFTPDEFTTIVRELYGTIPNFVIPNRGTNVIRARGFAAAEALKFSKDSVALSLARKAGQLGETSSFRELQRLRSAISGSLRKTKTELDPAQSTKEMTELLEVVDDAIETFAPNAGIAQNFFFANELVRQERVGKTIERFMLQATKDEMIQGNNLLNTLTKLDKSKAKVLFGSEATWKDFQGFARVVKTVQDKAGVAPELPLAVGLGQLSVLTGLFGGTITTRTAVVAALPLMALALASRPTAKWLTEGFAKAGTREGVTAITRLATLYAGRQEQQQQQDIPPAAMSLPGVQVLR